MKRIVFVLMLLVSASVWAWEAPADFCGKKDTLHCDMACLARQAPDKAKCMTDCREQGVLCGAAAQGTPQQGPSKAEADARAADAKKSLCMKKATNQCWRHCDGMMKPEARNACRDKCRAKGEAACGA